MGQRYSHYEVNTDRHAFVRHKKKPKNHQYRQVDSFGRPIGNSSQQGNQVGPNPQSMKNANQSTKGGQQGVAGPDTSDDESDGGDPMALWMREQGGNMMGPGGPAYPEGAHPNFPWFVTDLTVKMYEEAALTVAGLIRWWAVQTHDPHVTEPLLQRQVVR